MNNNIKKSLQKSLKGSLKKNTKGGKKNIIHDIYSNDVGLSMPLRKKEALQRRKEYVNSLTEVFSMLIQLNVLQIFKFEDKISLDENINNLNYFCKKLAELSIIESDPMLYPLTYAEKLPVYGVLIDIDGLTSESDFIVIDSIESIVPGKPVPFVWELEYRYEKAVPMAFLIRQYAKYGYNIIPPNILLMLILDILAPAVSESNHNSNNGFGKSSQRDPTEKLSLKEMKGGIYFFKFYLNDNTNISLEFNYSKESGIVIFGTCEIDLGH